MTALTRYRAPSIPTTALVGLALLFACLTVLRGIGWATGETGTTVPTVTVDGLRNAGLGPQHWGVVMMLVGALILCAYACRVHVFVFLAHGLAAVTYLAVTVGLAQAALDLGSGWQVIGPVLGGFVWHTLVAVLTRPLPPRPTGAAGDPH